MDWENTPLLQGPEKKLLTVKMTQSLLPGVVLIGSVDEHGQTLKTSTRMLGTTLETFQVTRDQALKAIEGSELDLAVSTLIKVPRIRHPQQTKKVVYRATTLGQNPLEILPTGETQTIIKTGAETAELTVISLPIPAQATIEPVDGRFTAASQYLQRDDVIVQQHAQKGAGDETDPAQIARRMESYVHTALTKKNFSTAMASAGEVARTLEGDCTEHALLLAAMLRVKAIPSRVAVGLVYVDSLSAFGGHMWTEACLNGHSSRCHTRTGRNGGDTSQIVGFQFFRRWNGTDRLLRTTHVDHRAPAAGDPVRGIALSLSRIADGCSAVALFTHFAMCNNYKIPFPLATKKGPLIAR